MNAKALSIIRYEDDIQWRKSKLLTKLLKNFDIIEGGGKIIKCSKY